MTRISAAENHTIDMDFERWQLNQQDEEGNITLVIDAKRGEPIHYNNNFAVTRHLPVGGELPLEYIQQVVVGWSYEDEAWHLGLLLMRDLADARKSRWCEVARWPDPDLDLFTDISKAAGQSLSQILGKPLNCVSPRPENKREAPSLPELPLEVGIWTLTQAGDNQLEFIRARKWAYAQTSRLVWYIFWAMIYLLLSLMTLNSSLALPNAGTMLPNPQYLPYIGLATAALLVGMVFYLLYRLLTTPNRILIDGEAHRVVGCRGQKERWEKTGNNLCDVYVTQVVKDKRDKRTVYHGEINLRQTSGEFYCLFQNADREEENLPVDEAADGKKKTVESEDMISALTAWDDLNNLQSAGLHIAKTLGDMPCWYDRRNQ
jgi:hypothetical protein